MTGYFATAQNNPICVVPVAAEACDDACINCDFGGAGGSTGGFAADGANGFCSGIQNDQWYGFIAGRSVDVTFTLSPSNCTNGDGVQIALYPNCSSGFLACDGGGTGLGNTPISITAGLIEGQTYFLVIDGFGGDVCNFALSVSPASAVRAPIVRPAGPIIGPSKVCPGATVVYTITPAQGAQFYTWTIPPDATINGLPGPGPHTFEVAEGTSVEITFGSLGGAITVEPSNACRKGSLRTKPVTVAPIPPTILPTVDVCFNEFPYGLPWGNDANNPGFYTETLVTPAGCDSVVSITLRGRPSYNNPPVPKFVCADNPCLNICGTEYCAPATVSAQCKTFKYDCDSIVNLEMVILNPVAVITNGATATMTCANNRIILRSAPSATGSIKTWRTLTGGLLGTGDTLVVTAPGSYVLNTTMSSQTTSCTKLDTIRIIPDLLAPSNTPAVSGQIGCGGLPVTLSTATNVANATYTWTGPAGFTLTTQPMPTTLITGTYTVVIRSPLNGCTSSATVQVQGSTTPPDVATTTNTLTCANASAGVTISATSTVPGATYLWAGSSLSSTTVPNPTVNISGNYTVTVTNPQNRCTATATVTVNLDNTPPATTASTLGTISCTTPNVGLNATPATGVTYTWNNGSTAQNPSVSVAGSYTVTVRNNSNGCTATATTSVTGDITPPNASTNGGLINCTTTSIVLTGASTTTGAAFSWSGPVTSSGATVTANAAGTYTLTVRGPNACTSTAVATVISDMTPPNASAMGGTVSCASTSIELKGNSSTPGATYSWAGPGTPGPVQNPVVSLPGTYTLTVRGPNGCTATATAQVTADAGTPQVTANGGTITCANPTVTLTASATPAGVQLEWINPAGQLLPSTSPIVSIAGVYKVKALNPNNGCEIEANVNVLEDKTPPGASATGGTVSCKDATITINGSSPATNVTSWNWTGPGGFISSVQNPNNVTAAGPYVLTVRGNNGCTSTITATVLEDKVPPVVNATGAVLTCDNPSRTINSTSSVPSTYSWSGPGSPAFTSNLQNPVVNLEGTYRVTITSNANGCTSTTSAPVDLDKTPPGVTAAGDTLTCTKQQVTINATPGTGTPTYSWTGPAGPVGATQNPSVSAAGMYTVTAKGPNGCTSTATAEVFENKAKATITNQTPDVITCQKDTITIDATVTNAQSPVTGVVWTNGGGFNSTAQDPLVWAPGNYTIVATSANGCTSEKVIAVTEDKAAPNISANGATLDCAVTSVRITGSSTTPGATFSWSNSGGVISGQQSPNVANPGTYTLVVTGPNGCTASTTAVVNANINAPNLSSTKSDDLDCSVTSVALTANSTTPGISYEWLNPTGTVAGSLATLNVTAPGSYIVKVTAPNGCISRDTQTVTQDIVKPDITATGALVTCADPSPSIAAASNTTGVTYSWVSSVSPFNSTQQNPQVTQSGTYTVTAKAPNGCTSTTTAQVQENKVTPTITNAAPDVITCKKDTITIDATITNAQSAVTGVVWSGVSGFNSVAQDPQVWAPGSYTIVATSANGCTSEKIIAVTQDKTAPDISAKGATLDCAITSIAITGNSTTAGATFSWSNAAGFSSQLQNPTVSNPGTYTLVVTGTNGCTASTTAVVDANINAPNLTTAKSDDLDCNVPTIALTATSTTTGVSYEWLNPAGTVAGSQATLNVTIPGNYIVKVTAPNGCISRDTQTVTQDIVKPDVTATGALITCADPTPSIASSSNTPGVIYSWTSTAASFTSALQNPQVTQNGTYTVTAKAPNGCTQTAEATVTKDVNIPDIQTQTPAVLTCTDTTSAINISVVLPSSITQTGLSWSSSTGFTSSSEDISVTRPGTYTVLVTSSNGCEVTTSVTVIQDIKAPGATATAGTLTCANPSFTLTGASPLPTADVTWAWTGPTGATFNVQNPTVTESGTYTLVVTSVKNGCTSVANAELLADKNAPVATAASADTLTCKKTTIGITAGSSLAATYSWTGPSFASTLQNPVNVTLPGTYTVTVKANINGCTDTQSVEVVQNIVAPDAVMKGDTLSCNRPSVPISVTTTAPGPRYSWSGPTGVLTNTTANPSVSNAGSYAVTVTGYNGCTTIATVAVLTDSVRAVISGTPSKVLTCTDKTVGIQATVNSISPVVSTTWSGPSPYTSSVEDPVDITVPGIYTLTVRPANGCTSSRQIEVKQDTLAPRGVTTKGDTLTCLKTAVNLASNSTTSNVTYAWTGPVQYTSNRQNPLDLTVPGTYTVVVTGANGCTTAKTAIIAENVSRPGATATASIAQLDCDDLETQLNGASATAGVSYLWTGPGLNDAKQNSKTTRPGAYILVVTAPNSCISRDTVTITQDVQAPNASATGGTIDCTSSQTVINGASTTANVTYSWAGPNQTSFQGAAPTVTQPGTYTLTVQGANACTATATATVNPNLSSPVVNLTGAGTLTCTTKSLLLSAAVNSPVSPVSTTVWTNAAGVSVSNTDTLRVSTPGIYKFTATSQNGCKSTPELTVLQDIVPPQDLKTTGGKLDCNFPTTSIGVTSATTGVTYLWSGPGGAYSSTLPNPSDVKTAGTYTVVVTNPVNGCTSSATAVVTEDPTKPELSAKTDTLTCARTTVTLNATTNTAGATFQWSGPISSTLEDPTTTAPGVYRVVAKGPNGCTSEFSITVPQNIAAPNLSVQGDTITCATNTGTVTAASTTPNVRYAWTGPGTFSSAAAAPVVTEVGTYTVIATAIANGCTTTRTVQVSPDKNAPVITAKGGTVTCAAPSLTLSATANTNVTWKWTGPNGFTSAVAEPTANAAGNYTVEATSVSNQCKVSTSVEIKSDQTPPVVSLSNPAILTCTVTEVDVTASTGASGVYSFAWSGGNIVSGAQSATVRVSAAANYVVTVTNTQNGCTATRTAKVDADPATPSGLGFNNRDITCFGAKNGAIIIDSIKGGTAPILFSLNGSAFTNKVIYTNLIAGKYTVDVEDANGCTFSTTVDIKEPEELIVNLGKDTSIVLGQSILLSLDDIVNIPSRVDTMTLFPASLSTMINNDTFTPIKSLLYQVTVQDKNGCKATDERRVFIEKTRHIYIPQIFAPTSTNNNIFHIQTDRRYDDVKNIKSFMIFDRWGNALHEYSNFLPNDIASGWDGRFGGKDVLPGVYVYFAEIEFIDGETVLYKGDVTVTR